MFKEDKNRQTSSVETIIGPSVKVEGDFVGQGDIIVQGIVLGNLKTKGHLEVGQDARITADVEAGSAHIAGEISGNILVKESLELEAAARIKGDIITGSLSVEKGAQLNGKISMDKSQLEKPKEVTEKLNK